MSKDPVQTEIERAISLQNQGNNADAVKIAQWALTHHPRHAAAIHAAMVWARAEGNNPDAVYALCSCYLLLGQFENAIQGLRLVIRMRPDFAAAYSALAAALNKMGEISEAMAMTEKALELDPNDVNGLINVIDNFYSMGEMDKGLAYAKKIEKTLGKNGILMMLFARLYESMGDIPNSMHYNRKAIQIHPDNPSLRAASLSTAMTSGNEKMIRAELKPAYDTFSKQPHFKGLMPQAWNLVNALHALANKTPLTDAGRILANKDMNNDRSKHLELITDAEPIWLFHLKGIRFFTTDFILYDTQDIFMNMQVTGVPFRFIMNSSLDNSTYIEENFPSTTIEERGFLLGGTDNYYHWLFDYLPRIAALEAHPEYKDLPIYINENTAEFQWQTLELLGIARDRIRHYPAQTCITLKDMILPYMPGRPMKSNGEPDKMKPNENPFIMKWLRTRFIKPENTTTDKKRYFISRADAKFRRCLNEDAIFAVAEGYGFEKLKNEGKSFAEQVAIYQNAEAIIGPHGAGFTNMIFSPPDATIIEFLPKGRHPAFYSAAAKANGQRYATIEGPIMRPFPGLTSDFGNFTLDVEEFRALMRDYF